ncbi:hypothetical protein LZA78_02845 [Sinirhodobacter sp. WL0062]|uniref:Uncharacterized protein n=1 Tax=Rhodobacter flavimaris TaxID=2907145 RepID=A0ABS8YRB8_9RHOB|nr:hypothetical protein [Sinirhodobacter sp. WL0062]MCE5972427.1 hypothetical protein [Sinirhodobacter sp. WL0062]
MILSFEELIVQCVNDQAKVHIREAVSSYEAGAYRAAIVSAYVAVCFDLIAKLGSLASGGDQDAVALVDKLEKLQEQQRQGNPQAIKGLLEIERNLLEDFRDKFDFFGHQEFEELSRLRADRNRCAHPTFSHDALPYSPAAELARLHIRSALTYVLSQPARQGKAALAGLRAVIMSPYFPSVLNDAVVRLRGTEIGSAREPLVRAFVDDLVFGWPDPNSPYHAHDNVLVAIEAAVELNRPVVVPRLKTAIEKLAKSGVPDAVRFSAAVALCVLEAGEQVDEATKVVLRTWLKHETFEDKGLAVKSALRLDWWHASALDAMATLNANQLAGVVDPPPEMITRAAQVYATATNWDQANTLAASIANPLADRLSPDDIALVLNASHNGADLRGSHGFREFINLLYDKNPIDNVALEALFDEHHLEAYKRAAQVLED